MAAIVAALLTMAEVASKFGICIRTLRAAARAGRLRAEKVDHIWLVSADAVRAWIATRHRPRGRPPKPIEDYQTRYCPCGEPIPKISRLGNVLRQNAYRNRTYCKIEHRWMPDYKPADDPLPPLPPLPSAIKLPPPLLKTEHPLMLTRVTHASDAARGYQIIHVPTMRVLVGSLSNQVGRAMLADLISDGRVDWHFTDIAELTHDTRKSVQAAIRKAGHPPLR